jgi:nitrate reductase NapAB chaperone NapD
VLLRQIDSELVQHLPGVSLEGAKQGAVSVHNDEAKLIVISQQRRQRLRVELNKKISELNQKIAMQISFHHCQLISWSWKNSMAHIRRFVMLCLHLCQLTLLSHKYREVLIGLKGSKSMLTFFSLPSSVTMVPQ